ncbi:hypothetical protein AAFF_G00275890 [Aldrovandia affinis]|uniref:DDE-1 domain-containing protein n=1 Tax=Aldrovandia affinis TaxID=143900 RepID=A0AAD7RB66_9TELE|nr:hypothetical protein AAFF_G00275890 [Aldrovandia affinis]
MVIFKGKRVRHEWLYGSPDNILVKVSDNGWINTELLIEWGKTFVSELPKDENMPHLLLLDGHSSHVYNMEFLTYMKKNYVHVMSYPPHTTHALQPADRALFKSLKHNWSEAGRRWNRQSCGMKLPKLQFFSVFTEAWKKTATVENAQSGFKATGMFPVNINAISADFFIPSTTMERALQPLAPVNTEKGENSSMQVHDDLCSTDSMKQALSRLSPRKVCGPDGITAWLLKEHAEDLAPVLNHIVNTSYWHGTVSAAWKSANVCPIPKVSNPSTPSDWRPISLTFYERTHANSPR